MSFIAGYLMGLDDGGSYKNEPKAITENGIYIPDSGVRWNSVLVNVPSEISGGDILGVVQSTPAFYSQAFEDGYTVELCVDFDNKLNGCVIQSSSLHVKVASIGGATGGKAVTFIPSILGSYFKFIRVLKDGAFVFATLETTNVQLLYGEMWDWTSLGTVDKKAMYDIVPRCKYYCKSEKISVMDGNEMRLVTYKSSGSTGYYTGVSMMTLVTATQHADSYYYKENGTYDYDVSPSDSKYTFDFTGRVGIAGSQLYTPLQSTDLLHEVTGFLVMAIRHNGGTIYDPYDFNPSIIK